MLVSSKSQLKLLLEREAVDTSTSGTNIPAALRSVPDHAAAEEKKDSGLSHFVARSTGSTTKVLEPAVEVLPIQLADLRSR